MYGYENLVWVSDKDGKEFVCALDRHDDTTPTRFDELSEHERQSCRDVNEIIGTERW